jgi:hypothetical protein
MVNMAGDTRHVYANPDLFRLGQGPFKEDAFRIKQSRLLKNPG